MARRPKTEKKKPASKDNPNYWYGTEDKGGKSTMSSISGKMKAGGKVKMAKKRKPGEKPIHPKVGPGGTDPALKPPKEKPTTSPMHDAVQAMYEQMHAKMQEMRAAGGSLKDLRKKGRGMPRGFGR